MPLLFLGCETQPPLKSIHVATVQSVTILDCEGNLFQFADVDRIGLFWQAITTAEVMQIPNLRRSTGTARIKVEIANRSRPIRFDVFASKDYGPVIRYNRERLVCKGCLSFFRILRHGNRSFNWCKSPALD